MTSFDELLRRYPITGGAPCWRAIRNCPGRYALTPAAATPTIEELVGDLPVEEKVSARARDPVLLVALEGGGIISYRRDDGTILHTLNDRDGFARKLAQLELAD